MGILNWLKNNDIVLSRVDYNLILESEEVDSCKMIRRQISELEVRSGRLVVTDPLVLPDLAPLSKDIPLGSYPLILHFAESEAGEEVIALAELKLNEERPMIYELALRDGEQLDSLGDNDDFIGFPVDSGLACMAEQSTMNALMKDMKVFEKQQPGKNYYEHCLSSGFGNNARRVDDPGDWYTHSLPKQEQVSMFSAGAGDGLYPVYYGIDKSLQIANIVIDFQILLSSE